MIGAGPAGRAAADLAPRHAPLSRRAIVDRARQGFNGGRLNLARRCGDGSACQCVRHQGDDLATWRTTRHSPHQRWSSRPTAAFGSPAGRGSTASPGAAPISLPSGRP